MLCFQSANISLVPFKNLFISATWFQIEHFPYNKIERGSGSKVQFIFLIKLYTKIYTPTSPYVHEHFLQERRVFEYL